MSKETDCLIAYVKAKVPGAVVTGVLGRYISKNDPCSPHAAKSLHCAEGTDGNGLAVDWGGDEGTILAVFNALAPIAPRMAELFHNGPGITKVVKNGMWRDGLATLGALTWTAHRNHCHSAVAKGTFLTPAVVIPPPPPTVTANPPVPTVPIPVHDFEENSVKTTMLHVGPLDGDGNGWGDWQPGLGRDPNPVSLVIQGPSPPDDGNYWMDQAKVQVAAQPRGGALRVVVRGGKPGDTITLWATVS